MKPHHTRFYLIIIILLLLVVLLGFGPRFYLRPFFEQPRHLKMDTLPIKFMLHGILMTLWYVLLVVQSALVNTKNIQLHKRLGWGLGVIAILAVISAIPVMMGFAPRMVELGFLNVDNPDRVWFQNIQWTNDIFALITFSIMVTIGFLNRTNKGLHRTMMLFASMAFTGPATGRLMEWSSPSLFIEGTVTVYFMFPVAVLIHDWFKARKIPVYTLWGFLALTLSMILTFALPSTEFWKELFLRHL
ncbi:MAG: hypothetical protein ACXIUD_15235 [Mongoliitalea sp.]